MSDKALPGLPGLPQPPPPEPIEIEPELEQVVRLRADCPKCKAVFRSEDPRLIQHIGNMGAVATPCGKCGQPLVVRRKLVALVNEHPNRAARRLAQSSKT